MHDFVLKAGLWIESSIDFCRITIPAFYASDLKRVAITGLHLQIYNCQIP